MPRITQQTIERVREAADFQAIVEAHTELRSVGPDQLQGRCPFHEDKTPSFAVNTTDKVYNCLGCEASGDVFRFVMETEDLDFHEAVVAIAERSGVEVDFEASARKSTEDKQRDRLYELLERAATYYRKTFTSSEVAAPAREYLTRRGYSEEVLESYGIGFAPNAWNKLYIPALEQGFTQQELIDAGLARRKRDDDGLFDRFRGRIMFPVTDTRGRVHGFGARTITGEEQKYLNSSNGPVYTKGRELFGIKQARRPAARARAITVVEGYADVLALATHGFSNVVGLMGTALTADQAKAIAGLAPAVTIVLDGELATRPKAIAAAEAVAAAGAQVRIAQLPERHDPDSFLRDEGSEAFDAVLAAAQTIPEASIALALATADLTTPRGRDEALAEVTPHVGLMSEGPLKEEQLRVISEQLQLPTETLRVAIAQRS